MSPAIRESPESHPIGGLVLVVMGRLGCARSVSELFGPIDMDLERLVDELLCGNHGLGDVSRFLLRALRARVPRTGWISVISKKIGFASQ